MKKSLLLLLLFQISCAVGFGQIQEYFVNKEIGKSYDSSLKAWDNWGQWQEPSKSFSCRISDNALIIFKGDYYYSERKDTFYSSSDTITLTFSNKNNQTIGNSKWLALGNINHTFRSGKHKGDDKPEEETPSVTEAQGSVSSENASWDDIRYGRVNKATICITANEKFQKCYQLDIKSLETYSKEAKEKADREAEAEEARQEEEDAAEEARQEKAKKKAAEQRKIVNDAGRILRMIITKKPQ